MAAAAAIPTGPRHSKTLVNNKDDLTGENGKFTASSSSYIDFKLHFIG